VKLIGATAHYVTRDLDEGRSSTRTSSASATATRPEISSARAAISSAACSARAIRYHLDDRVILNGRKTVVFVD
jgi:formyltetrahydrofolate deformylase